MPTCSEQATSLHQVPGMTAAYVDPPRLIPPGQGQQTGPPRPGATAPASRPVQGPDRVHVLLEASSFYVRLKGVKAFCINYFNKYVQFAAFCNFSLSSPRLQPPVQPDVGSSREKSHSPCPQTDTAEPWRTCSRGRGCRLARPGSSRLEAPAALTHTRPLSSALPVSPTPPAPRPQLSADPRWGG